jgi:hypothetical protein
MNWTGLTIQSAICDHSVPLRLFQLAGDILDVFYFSVVGFFKIGKKTSASSILKIDLAMSSILNSI